MTTQNTNDLNTPDFGGIKVVRTSGGRPVATMDTVTQVETESVTPVVTTTSTEPIAPRKSWLARFWWLPVLALLAIGAAIWGRNYYESRYVGTEYWAQIPATFDVTPHELTTMDGEGSGDMGVDYVVTGFNEAGESRQLEFTVRGENAADMPQPGSFVELSASDQLVVSHRVVSESEVPTNVIALLRGN